MAATAAAVIGIATPASAAVSFASYSGADLVPKIKASTTNTTNDASSVYGCTQNDGACANVTFTGRRSDSATLENIHITDGAGFASITDSPNNATNQFYELMVDLTASDFNQYMFSLQLVNDGTIFVYYMLASGGGWQQATPLLGIDQKANGNNTYLLQGDTFTAVYVRSNSPIKEFKQQSVTLGSIPAPVPEPATWAMMLLGFGGIGLALRRSRRRGKQALMQIA
jgi:hypothetical protein